MGETLLPIGQFSARCRLSPKALRLYDSLGLVVPVQIDPLTGYRWYSAGQAERARLIADWRTAGPNDIACDVAIPLRPPAGPWTSGA